MELSRFALLAGSLFEAAGVFVMLGGGLWALASSLWRLRCRRPSDAYRRLRHDLGRAILLGLEFLVAADIIRTVSSRPTLVGVAVLAVIVLIRTFLSFTLEVELEGKWPWRRAAGAEAPGASHDEQELEESRPH
ncbi:MAG: DUF1622 domain-containing protein [Myxococcales bacterium]